MGSQMQMLLKVTLEVVTVLLLASAGFSLYVMLHAWHSEENNGDSTFPIYLGDEKVKFSILIPARHEEDVLGVTLSKIAEITYSDFEVIVIIGHDDDRTLAVARDSEQRFGGIIKVVIDDNWPKSKPKALNTGLRYCTGDFITIFDAEDDVASSILTRINMTVLATNAKIIQAPVQLMNVSSNWFSFRNCLEYYLWFRSRLKWQSGFGVVPLGGNTVFIERNLLLELGGWDSDALTEDCDLGVRAGVVGASVFVGYDSSVATREETPLTLKAFAKQRSRWNQGFFQVLVKGDWMKVNGLGAKAVTFVTLITPLIQVLNSLSFILAIVGVVYARLGENQAIFLFTPLIVLFATAVFEVLIAIELCRDFDINLKVRYLVVLILSLIPYQFILSFSAIYGVGRHVFGRKDWLKTDHTGAHRSLPLGSDTVTIQASVVIEKKER